MNKSIYFLLILVFISSCQKFDTQKIVNSLQTKSEESGFAIKIGREDVLSVIDSLYSSTNTNVWLSPTILEPNDTIRGTAGLVMMTPNYKSWLFIVDLHPLANWDHECEYFFVNAMTREIECISSTYLPLNIKMELIKEYFSDQKEGKLFDLSRIKEKGAILRSPATSNNKWAVIISGGVNPRNNYARYWNDCSLIYTTITSVYGYSKTNTFVLMSDGLDPTPDSNNNNYYIVNTSPDLDGDGLPDIDYAATRSNITTVFNTLGAQVSSGDDVFIYVIDHGARDNGQSYICLWNETDISQTEFANEVNKITTSANVHIVMGQCNSGGFISSFVNRPNTTIATACLAGEVSYAAMSGYYDEFVYHWTSAVLGEDAYGNTTNADYSNDGCVSIYEAFHYANTHDVEEETPQYHSNINTFGDNHSLAGKLFDMPLLPLSFSCPSSTDLRVGQSYVYSINNVPNNASVTWNCTGRASFQSTGGNSATLSSLTNNRIYTNINVSATVSIPRISRQFVYRHNGIVFWKSGISMADDLIVGSLTNAGGNVELVQNFVGAYGYQWHSDRFVANMQGYYFTTFVPSRSSSDEVSVSVDFYNPFGEQTTIVKKYYL